MQEENSRQRLRKEVEGIGNATGHGTGNPPLPTIGTDARHFGWLEPPTLG